jgi:hypothetical protein
LISPYVDTTNTKRRTFYQRLDGNKQPWRQAAPLPKGSRQTNRADVGKEEVTATI